MVGGKGEYTDNERQYGAGHHEARGGELSARRVCV
jgi:hypothetical protein